MGIVKKIRTYFGKHPEQEVNFFLNTTFKINEVFEDMEKDPLRDTSFDSLEQYETKFECLADMLDLMPAEKIHKEFGEDALIWTWLRNQNKEKLTGISDLTKKDPEALSKAAACAGDFVKDKGMYDILKSYELIETSQNGFAKKHDIKPLLNSYLLGEKRISDDKLNCYSIAPISTYENQSVGYEKSFINNENKTKIFLESPIGFSLNYKSIPSAVVSFFYSNRDTVMIHQLQGIKTQRPGEKEESTKGLSLFDWRKLMIDYVEKLADDINVENIAIKSAYNADQYIRPRFDMDLAVKKYDDVAERLGFKQADDGNWYKSLKKESFARV